jgi:hypothetical protein
MSVESTIGPSLAVHSIIYFLALVPLYLAITNAQQVGTLKLKSP